MQYEKLYSFVIPKLEKELPSWIVYHDAAHTKSVISSAEYLAEAENISGDELILLKTAALLHDAGFLNGSKKHEVQSCTFARKHLPAFDYTEEQIENICGMIMATKLPQDPGSDLAKILCDADLFYLGTDQYTENAEKLFSEFRKTGLVKSRGEWLMKQADFLSVHKYFTQTAQREREEKKQEALRNTKTAMAETLTHRPGASEMIKDTCLMIAGAVISAFSLKEFLVPNHFFDGGITGISMLLHEFSGIDLILLILILNIPLIIVSYFSIGKTFALKTAAGIILLGIAFFLLPSHPLTSDKILIAVFGGGFLGIGIGLVMRAGAALDGIEVLAVYTLKRTSFTITEIIMAINILIFTVAAFSFDLETALYSILTYFAATRCIDYVVEGLQAYTGVTIISEKSEEIKYALVNHLGRGITVYKGERGFLPGNFDVSTETDIIFTVITRLEMRKLNNLVRDIDSKSFIFANTIKEASGGVINRRKIH